MNRLITFMGLVCGCVATLAALLFNPLGPVVINAGIGADTYDWSALEFHGVEFDEATLLGLPLRASGQAFTAAGIESANASIMVLRGSDGEPAALVTRLVALDETGNLLRGDLGVNTYTNIYWPNRGSLLLYGYENRWPVIRGNVMGALGQSSESSWLVSALRRDGELSGVVGGSGVLERVGGRYSETLHPNPAGDGTFEGRISLELSFR